MQFFKKPLGFLVALSLIFSTNAPLALSFDLSSLLSSVGSGTSSNSSFALAGIEDMSVTAIVNEILGIFGIDKNEVKKSAAQFNAMSYKSDGPRVELSFVPSTPTPGEKITAVATPSYFSNQPTQMYYTWFLKKARCKETSCDYNKDGDVDINDYKIEAARLIASGDSEWQKLLGNQDPNCKNPNPPDHCTLKSVYDTPTNSDNDHDGYEAVIGGGDQAGKNTHCFLHNVAAGTDIEIGCNHVFPTARPKINESVGDGHFGTDEEEFWRTDPSSNDTANAGTMDEANVTGLGKMQFSWTYSPGDEVGVAIEGVSVNPTIKQDSSFKTMWAITNNPDVIALSDDKSNLSVKDINNALERGFIKPTSGTDYKKISNNLSVNLTNPQYDASDGGGNSDTITIRSNATNNENETFTKYAWNLDISSSADAADASWKKLTQTDLGNGIQLEGIGLKELTLPLGSLDPKKITSGTFYLRATLRTTENAAEGKKEGMDVIIIPVQTSKGGIIVTAATPTTSGNLEEGTPICTETAEKYLCPVTPNEVLSVNIPSSQYKSNKYSFSWTLDGKRLPAENNANTAFFPITGEVGKTQNIQVDIAGIDSTEKITFVRSFSVTDPATAIKSADSSNLAPILLGYYVDDKNNKWSDYSKDYFQAITGSTAKLQAQANTNDVAETIWYVDGTEVVSQAAAEGDPYMSADGKTLNIPIAKAVGDTYKVTAATPAKQDAAMKNILSTKWGISNNGLVNQDIVTNITIGVSDNINGTAVSAKNQPKILASLFAGLPSYVAFLFKIIVTLSLILFSSRMIISLSPQKKD